MTSHRAVVVGAGLGGLRAAEALRAGGFLGEVVLVGEERWTPYNRPPLTKEALARGVAHDRLEYPVRADGLSWRLGQEAVGCDLAARTVMLDDGTTLAYDLFVVATGVSPRRLSVPGPPAAREAGRFVVRTIDDAVALRPLLVPGSRLVLVGAGFIGCEVAATARGLGAEVEVVALDPLPMLRPLGPALAAELQHRHEGHGVRFHLGRTVRSFVGRDRVTGVVLDDGTEVPADLVVEALGSVPRTGWLAGNGLDLADGVLVDGALRPVRPGGSVDGVAVVGDVARYPNTRFGPGAWRVEHWSNPTDTGRRAGAVLASYAASGGGSVEYGEVVDAEFEPLPSFWSDQYDLQVQSFGLPSLADAAGIRLLEGELGRECVVGYYTGRELVGVVGIGMLRRVASYRTQIGVGRAAGGGGPARPAGPPAGA